MTCRASSLRWLSAAWLSLAMACGAKPGASDDAPHFPEQPLTTVASDSGQLQIAVRTSPDEPPTRGVVSAQLTLTDASTSAPATGLALVVTPWMPAMGHGTSTLPAVSETAPGVYLVTPIGAYMPGTWELRTDISGDTPDSGASGMLVDHVNVSIDIQ